MENTISNIFTIYILKKYLPKRESTHEHVQSCPSNKKREFKSLQYIVSFSNVHVCIREYVMSFFI